MSICRKTVYYTDGSSKIIEFEKLPGAHPDCKPVWKQALSVAEFEGKTVHTICNTIMYAGRPLNTETHTRDEIINMRG